MRDLLILGGVLVILAGLAYAWGVGTDVDALKATLAAVEGESFLQEEALRAEIDRARIQMWGSALGGFLAALPYFALARLVRPKT